MNVSALASAITLAATLAMPASAQDRVNGLGNGVAPMATTDPQLMIYRVAGVRNTSEASATGIATTFFCYNNSPSVETIRLRILGYNGTLITDFSRTIHPKRTLTLSTHATNAFSDDEFVAVGDIIDQGSAAIIATSKEIFCSAMVVDATPMVPNGIALHMVRFNPAPGSVE